MDFYGAYITDTVLTASPYFKLSLFQATESKSAPISAPNSAPISAPKSAPKSAPISPLISAPISAPISVPKSAPISAPISVPIRPRFRRRFRRRNRRRRIGATRKKFGEKKFSGRRPENFFESATDINTSVGVWGGEAPPGKLGRSGGAKPPQVNFSVSVKLTSPKRH